MITVNKNKNKEQKTLKNVIKHNWFYFDNPNYADNTIYYCMDTYPEVILLAFSNGCENIGKFSPGEDCETWNNIPIVLLNVDIELKANIKNDHIG